jgi:formylglycine-generating enzyme
MGATPRNDSGAHPLIAGTGWQIAWNGSLPGSATDLKTLLNCDSLEQTWTAAPGANENKAINCVNWFEAFAFCIWDGGRLPTEAEWEYAAAGGSENRIYPWGLAAPTTSLAVFGCQVYPGGTCVVLAVGSAPIGNGKWDHADLAGNVWEWAFDWYAAYSASANSNFANTTTGSNRVVRGGYFASSASLLLAASREGPAPGYRSGGVGGRCSRAPRY